jgi:hypothetical protein
MSRSRTAPNLTRLVDEAVAFDDSGSQTAARELRLILAVVRAARRHMETTSLRFACRPGRDYIAECDKRNAALKAALACLDRKKGTTR